MPQQKFVVQYRNFLGQVKKDHKTFSKEGKELNKRLEQIKKESALNGQAEIIVHA